MTSKNQRAAIADEFERHIRDEDAILKEYHVLVDQLPDGPLCILINHITTEEEMHHFLLSTLAEWLRSVPDEKLDSPDLGVDRAAIVERARILQQHEQTTIDACTALKSDLKGDQGEIFDALLDVLILDSQKHHRLLLALESVASA